MNEEEGFETEEAGSEGDPLLGDTGSAGSEEGGAPSGSEGDDSSGEGQPQKENLSVRDQIEEAYKQKADQEETTPKRGRPRKEEREVASSGEQIRAPMTWSKEEKEWFTKLPSSVQKTLSARDYERESSRSRAQHELSLYRQTWGEVEQMFAPYAEELAAQGATPAHFVKTVIARQRLIDKDPASAIRQIAARSNLDLSSLSRETPRLDPHTERLTRELQEVKQVLNSRSLAERQQIEDYTDSEIESFASEADETGNYRYPHFNDVYWDMIPIVAAMRQSNPTAPHRVILEAAYDRAVYANPTVREQMINQRLSSDQQAKKAQAEKARLAGSSLNGSPGGTPSTQAPVDIRGLLEASWEGRL